MLYSSVPKGKIRHEENDLKVAPGFTAAWQAAHL